MKKFLFIIVGLSILLFSKPGFCSEENDNQIAQPQSNSTGNSLTILCSPDMVGVTSDWANQFQKTNPLVNITISDLNDKPVNYENIISLVSDGYSAQVGDESNMRMLIGRNVIVPVLSRKNPALAEISQQGITSGELSILFSESEKQNWTSLINGGPDVAVHYYIIDNENVKNDLSKFVKTSPAFKNAIFVKTGEELLGRLNQDIYSIGFCSLAQIMDPNTNQLAENVNFLPIDKNKNGRIDNFENIYENLTSFTRGVWIGKYPSDLSGNIYAVTTNKPKGKEAIAFLSWLTTDGQQLMNGYGLCAISSSEKESNLLALTTTEAQIAAEEQTSNAGVWIILLAVVFVGGFIVTAVVRSIKKAQGLLGAHEVEIKPALDENSIEAPKGLYFDRTHTWAFMEKDGTVKVGVDDFLQHITGQLTRIKMKSPGEKIRRGEKILTINRNGKQLEISSPVTGTIKEQNEALNAYSSMVNSSPYTDGWVYSIEPTNWLREIQLMFMAEKYREWLKNEFSRLKDFFAAFVRSNDVVYAHIVLQDGGELADNVLEDLGPEVWEEFQNKFINSSK